MLRWLDRHAQAIQAAGAIVMSAAALAAAVFVPWQIAANDRTSREQAAREIYREFLNISIQRPELAAQDICTLTDPARRTAYESYVDYLLYTAEQVMALNPSDWEADITARLHSHTPYLCSFGPADLAAMTPAVAALIGSLTTACDTVTTCNRVQP
jgi:hypothetical protein